MNFYTSKHNIFAVESMKRIKADVKNQTIYSNIFETFEYT
jgi:hypothetical protein